MKITDSGIYIISPQYKGEVFPSNLTELYRDWPQAKDAQRLALMHMGDYMKRGRALDKRQWRVATHLAEMTHPLRTTGDVWSDDPPKPRSSQSFYLLSGDTKRLFDILTQRERKSLLELPGLKWFLRTAPKLEKELSVVTSPHQLRVATEQLVDEKLARLARSPHAVARPDGFAQYARQLRAEHEATVRERLTDDFYVAKLSAADKRARRSADKDNTLRRVQLFREIASEGLRRYTEKVKLPNFLRTYMLRNRLGRVVVDLEEGKLVDVIPPGKKA